MDGWTKQGQSDFIRAPGNENSIIKRRVSGQQVFKTLLFHVAESEWRTVILTQQQTGE